MSNVEENRLYKVNPAGGLERIKAADVAPANSPLTTPQAVQHYHHNVPGKGTVTVKVERNSRGTNVEIRIDRPIEERAIDTGLDILQDIAAIQRAVDDPNSDYNLTLRRQLAEAPE